MKGRAALLAILLLGAGSSLPAEETTQQERSAKLAQLPNWDGQWQPEFSDTTIGGSTRPATEGEKRPSRELFGFSAPWNDTGSQMMADARKIYPGRKADGWGFPMMLVANAPNLIVVTPEQVVMVNAYRDLRIIRTDGKGHPPEEDLWPTTWGDSVGHWEGDTLVVDTIMVRNPNVFFHSAPTLSDDAHYAERIYLDKDGILVDEMTITDPTTLTKPWSMVLRFERATVYDRLIYDSYDGDRTGFDGEFNTIEPTE